MYKSSQQNPLPIYLLVFMILKSIFYFLNRRPDKTEDVHRVYVKMKGLIHPYLSWTSLCLSPFDFNVAIGE